MLNIQCNHVKWMKNCIKLDILVYVLKLLKIFGSILMSIIANIYCIIPSNLILSVKLNNGFLIYINTKNEITKHDATTTDIVLKCFQIANQSLN